MIPKITPKSLSNQPKSANFTTPESAFPIKLTSISTPINIIAKETILIMVLFVLNQLRIHCARSSEKCHPAQMPNKREVSVASCLTRPLINPPIMAGIKQIIMITSRKFIEKPIIIFFQK